MDTDTEPQEQAAEPAKQRRTRTPRDPNAPVKERTPSVKLDDEAKAYVAAVTTLTGLPFYEGPTVQQVIDSASAAASKAVHDLYANLMSKAKVR